MLKQAPATAPASSPVLPVSHLCWQVYLVLPEMAGLYLVLPEMASSVLPGERFNPALDGITVNPLLAVSVYSDG